MKKQIFKAATMFIGIIALALVSAIASSAQNQRSITVNIPFDFTVKGKTLPAGEYILSRGSAADRTGLVIARRDSEASAVVLTMPVESRESQSESRLVFNRYGERYFLSQVWIAGDSQGRELFKSNRESSMEMELARSNARPEVVAVTASTR
ncbi:MAG TPA: hypothetical protein VJS44_00935 [Pyrinomonadaceae bacterium]|nr:hypothetical protein [Pyrinomonadaceae bacterium]